MNVIAFTTIFLGLVTGAQVVEVETADTVALVELQLDGEVIALISSEPWAAACNFGPSLVPHELVAIAYDQDHQPLGRARQWLNLPRKPAELGGCGHSFSLAR